VASRLSDQIPYTTRLAGLPQDGIPFAGVAVPTATVRIPPNISEPTVELAVFLRGAVRLYYPVGFDTSGQAANLVNLCALPDPVPIRPPRKMPMNAEPVDPEPLKDDIAAKDRIRELEQELQAASDIIDEQEVEIECLRIQLEAAGLTIDEGTAARRKLEGRIADLEDELADEACHVPKEKSNREKP